MMALAVVLGMVFTTTGLWISYAWNLTSGASIILVAGLAYLLTLLFRTLRQRSALDQNAASLETPQL
jgi:zinc transport system permease protein